MTDSLVTIEYGAEADSATLNSNFDYLDDKIGITKSDLEAEISSAINNASSSIQGNCISKTGDTMTGNLGVSSGSIIISNSPTPLLVLKNTSQTAGTHPTANASSGQISCRDKDNKQVGAIGSRYRTDGTRETFLWTANDGVTGITAEMGIRISGSGGIMAYCPTPSINSNSNIVATTEWVRNLSPTLSSNSLPKWNSRSSKRAVNTWYSTTTNGWVWISDNVDESASKNYQLRIGTSSSSGDYKSYHFRTESPSSGRDNKTLMFPVPKGYVYQIYCDASEAPAFYDHYFIQAIGG